MEPVVARATVAAVRKVATALTEAWTNPGYDLEVFEIDAKLLAEQVVALANVVDHLLDAGDRKA